MARPSPVPPYRRVVELSSCTKASKIRESASGEMPTPVSLTSKARRVEGPSLSKRPTRTTISPRAVNFTALPTRLTRTWRSRPGSPRTMSGTSAATRARSSTSLALARSARSSTTPSTVSRRSKLTCSSSSLPASIREKSRMSSTMDRSDSPDDRASSASRRWLGVRPDSTSSSVVPRTPLSGVRISWLMLARNCDLARLADSAAALASRRSLRSVTSRTVNSSPFTFGSATRFRPTTST